MKNKEKTKEISKIPFNMIDNMLDIIEQRYLVAMEIAKWEDEYKKLKITNKH